MYVGVWCVRRADDATGTVQRARRVRSFLVRAHMSRIVGSPRAMLDVLAMLTVLMAFSLRCLLEMVARSLRGQGATLLNQLRPARMAVQATGANTA